MLPTNRHPLFTVGYAPLANQSFFELMQQHYIDAVVDVRSMPYSRVWSDFNRDILAHTLKKQSIHYVFMGDLCGARVEDAAAYADGVLVYEEVIKNKLFQQAMRRLKEGLKRYRIALMCAEKDPLCCHRFLLICRCLAHEIDLYHLQHDGLLESQVDAESRLLALHQLHHPSLFCNLEERIQQAYAQQHVKVFGL
ncbi:MAG: DUF488 domain-containing protein [Mariprofundaceae bacterium]|nr:DUF488 domain-containing protein [Mariprofundaceae bacterium]